MTTEGKPLVWLEGEVKSPPFTRAARIEAGFLLRRLQLGETIPLPHSRPMPSIGRRCHELRIQDESATWRIVVRVDPDAVIVLHVFSKKTQKTSPAVVQTCKARLRSYDESVNER